MLHAAAAIVCLVAAPSPAPIAELVGQLETCQDEACAPYVELIARGAKVWPELAVGLAAPAEMTRFWTIGVLAAVKVPAAREHLLGVLTGEPLVRVRAAAAFALGNLPKGEASAPIVQALVLAADDKDVNVRFEAISALARLEPPNVTATFIKAVRDHDEDVRIEAIDALAVLADPTARPALEERLQEDLKPGVRGHAAIALGNLKGPESVPLLLTRLGRERHPEALAALCWALGALGDKRAAEPLKPLLTHKEAVVRQQATEALALLEGPPAPVPPPAPIPAPAPPTR